MRPAALTTESSSGDDVVRYSRNRQRPHRDVANRTSTASTRLREKRRRGIPQDGAADATLGVLEEMYHPGTRFTDSTYAAIDLRRLAREFDTWLAGKERPVKLVSRRKYATSLDSLFRSIAAAGDPLELAYLHPMPVTRWIAEQRQRGLAEDGIASRLASVKVFAHAFVFRKLELSERDLLDKVARFTPPEKPMQILELQEIERVLDSFDDRTFEGRRDRAITAVLFATGIRLRELSELTVDAYDPVSAEFTVHGKGDRIRYVRLSDRAHRVLKAYLKIRPRGLTNALWVQDNGEPLGYWGAQSMLRRVKGRCGVPRFRAHLARHTFGSLALRNGAERAAVQDMLGHETDLMTRRYTREERKRTAAAMMPKYSPV